jgi:hypothetical protein
MKTKTVLKHWRILRTDGQEMHARAESALVQDSGALLLFNHAPDLPDSHEIVLGLGRDTWSELTLLDGRTGEPFAVDPSMQ